MCLNTKADEEKKLINRAGLLNLLHMHNLIYYLIV